MYQAGSDKNDTLTDLDLRAFNTGKKYFKIYWLYIEYVMVWCVMCYYDQNYVYLFWMYAGMVMLCCVR